MIFFFLVLVWFLFKAVNCSSYASADPSKVVDLAAFCTFLTISRHHLGGWLEP